MRLSPPSSFVGLGPLTLAAAVALSAPAPARAQAAVEARPVAIAAQALGDALNELAAATGTPIAFPQALVAGRTAPAASGVLTVRQALERLLAGSGLVADQEGGTWVIKAAPPPPAGEAAALAPVTVTALADRSGTTERTGAYTPRATGAATRLPLTLRETPQSVTVITSQQIEDRGITGLAQALDTVPGTHVTSDPERPQVYARGLVANLQVEGNPMFPGGAYTTNITGDNMIAYDRIEVLRGANGLMSGPGEPSGTISMVRKRATPEFQAHVQGGFGSWSHRFGEADLSGPLNRAATVRARLAVGTYGGDNYIAQTGRDGKALLATVEADLAPRTTARLGYQHDEYLIEGANSGALVPLWYSNGAPYNAPRSLGLKPRAVTLDHSTSNIYLGLEHAFDNGWKFQGLLDRSRRQLTFGPPMFLLDGIGYSGRYPDPSGIGTALLSPLNYQREDRQWAYNFDVQGPLTLFGREHRLMFGGSGWDRELDLMQWVIDSSNPPSASFYEAFPTLWASSWSQPLPYAINPFPQSRGHTEQHGLYAAARWDLADSLKLITGLRVTNWKTRTDRYNSVTGALTQANTGAYAVRREITPYVGAVWDFHPHLSAYASYADIFKPQNLYDSSDNLLEPIVGKNYEAGVKGEFLQRRLNASAAVFRLVQDNLGERDPSFPDPYLTPGGNVPHRSAGKGVTTRGFEVEASGSPQPGWNISAGYTYAKSENARGEPFNTNLPEHLLRLFTTYRLQGRWSGLTLGVGANWNSAISQVLPRPTGAYHANGLPVTADHEFRQGGVWRVTAMARYAFSPQLSLLLNVDNLLDKTYYSEIASWGPALAYYGQPRRWRATLRYQY